MCRAADNKNGFSDLFMRLQARQQKNGESAPSLQPIAGRQVTRQTPIAARRAVGG